MNKMMRYGFPLFLVFSLLFLAAPCDAQGTGDIRSLSDRYVSLTRKYTEAVGQNADAATLQNLARELRDARVAFETAGGIPGAAAPDEPGTALTGIALDEADTALMDAPQTRSPEEQRYDAMISRLYSSGRKTQTTQLVEEVRQFLQTASHPYFIMQATFELAELTFEMTKSAKAAEAVLAEYSARKAPTAEARRLAAARIRMYAQETKVAAQRIVYDKAQQKSLKAWDSARGTSWFAFPVKLTRLSAYAVVEFQRRHQGRELKKLLTDYDKTVQSTFARGTLDEFTNSQLLPCNDVTLLVNGRSSFARRYELAAQAKDKIMLQTLLYHDDEAGNRLADIFIERAQAGVEVRVIVDDAFAIGRKSGIFRRMEQGGVHVQINNPILENPLKANFRSHQKIFYIDDEVAIVGGMNIATEYAQGEIKDYGWRDTDVEVRGPVVAEIGELFERNWEELEANKAWLTKSDPTKTVTQKQEKLPILPNRDTLIPGPLPVYFQEPPVFRNVRVRFLKTFPTKSKDDDIMDLFRAYLGVAQREVILESAYFIPTPALKQAIIDACKRGVKVRIITNSVESNNHPNAGHAGRANYEDVLKAGAEIYEWQGAQTLHSKVTLFDQFAATLGAYNINSRSHSCDSEDIIAIEDRRFAVIFRKVLDLDLKRSRRVTLDDIERWRADFSIRAKMDFFNLFKSIF